VRRALPAVGWVVRIASFSRRFRCVSRRSCIDHFVSQNRDETIGQSLGFAAGASIFGKGASFLRGLVLARFLGAAELGLWSLVIHGVQLGAEAIALGVPPVMHRFSGYFRDEGRLKRLLLGGLLTAAVLVAAAMLLGWLFREQLNWLLFDEQGTPGLMFIGLIGLAATVTWNVSKAAVQGVRAFRADAIISLAYSGMFLLALIVLLAMLQPTALWCAVAYGCSTWVAALAALAVIGSRIGERRATAPAAESGTTFKTLGAYAAGVWSAGLLTILWKYLDRFMVLHLSTTSSTDRLAQLGDYFLAHKLAEPILLMAATVAGVMTSHVAHREENGAGEVAPMFRLSVKLGALLASTAGAIVIVSAPWVLPALFGRLGEWTLSIIAPATLSIVLLSLFFVIRPFLLSRRRTGRLLMVWAVTAGLNGGLNWWWVPQYQVVGAVAATALSAGFLVVATLYVARLDGLTAGRATLWVLAVPAMLLIPSPWQALAIMLVLALVAKTDLLLSSEEKSLLSSWSTRFRPRRFRERRATAPDVPSASSMDSSR